MNMMEQAHNPDLKIAERYFLGELTNDEAEAYEAHYFECPSCAEYVREELALIRSVQAMRDQEPRPAAAVVVPIESRRRRAWLPPAAAAAMLVVGMGIPALIPPGPDVYDVPPTRIQFSLDRAAAPPPRIFHKGKPITLDVEIPPADFPRFVVSIRDEANDLVGKEVKRTSEQTAEPVFLVLSALPAGTYNVVIEGVREDGNRFLVARTPIEVRGVNRKEGAS
jgi:FAD/FMN-containing dehydrogenase